MSFTSIIGICALAYTILVITFQCPLFYNNFKTKEYDLNNPKTHPNFFSLAPSLRADMNIFQCIATIFFCYACHIGAFPVYKSLKNPTHKRINIVYIGSLLLDFIIYFLVSVCGFLTAPIKQPSLIIYRENNNVIQNDIFMIVAKLSICVCLSMAIPPNYNSFRISFMTLFFGTSEISDKTNYILTISVIGISTFIGAVYNDILKFISLLGGFIGVVIAFLMPGLLYIKNNQYDLTNFRNICSLLFICSLCTIGFIAGIETILF
jgi:amino acid permease